MTSPFTFSSIPERTIFDFFKLTNLTDSCIGNYKKIVDLRNDCAHSNGNIFFNGQEALDDQLI
jgi:hypothetical protein